MKPQTIVQATLLTLSMTVCLPAYAENQALMTLLKALQENGTIDIQTYELVKRVALAETEDERQVVQQIAREEVSHSINEAAGKEATGKEATGKGGRPENSIRMGGRIQVDAASYREDSSRHNDGTEIRRARLFAEGDLGKAWGYKLQYDFTADGIDGIQDAYLDYKGFENLKVRMGHFKEPFSLQNMTSSKYVLFTERGLPHVFAEGRNLGLQLSRKGKNWSASAGLFGEGRDGASADNDEGFGASGRITYAPLYEKTQALHLGASASYRATGSTDTLRFRERPESHMTNTRLVDTGSIDADSYARFVGEVAYIYGPFHTQGEYYHTTVDREISGNEDLNFSGFYIEGGWFLTGESMNYKPAKGSFSRVTPNRIVGKSGIGAWQVALRYSSLDLSDEDILGGEEENFTVGLNWYATPNIRFAANYVNVLDVEGGPNDGDEPESFQIRTQLEF